MANSTGNGRRQLILSLALLALLFLFVLLQGAPDEPQPYDPTSAAPDGLLALHLWLADMGYTVTEVNDSKFAVTAESALLIILPTRYAYTEEEAAAVEQWIVAGGTAVMIGPNRADDALIARFGVQPGETTPLLSEVTPQQPIFDSALTAIDLTGELPTLDLSDAPAAVPILAADTGHVTAAVQQIGAGTVWHLNRHHLFINEQLRDPGQAALFLALLRDVPPGGTVTFDRYHLVRTVTTATTTVQTLQEWLYYTPYGWALLFALAVTALFLVLQGRRLGPALPDQAEVRPREAAEYIMAMANLARRARHHAVVAEHHKRRLKRKLGQRAHIPATLSDADFVRRLAASDTVDATVTAQNADAVIRKLDQAADEQRLVAAVTQVDALLERTAK
ncbi:MAG: DUF4350 domain-containing protein [Caldilineaceae bacterium]